MFMLDSYSLSNMPKCSDIGVRCVLRSGAGQQWEGDRWLTWGLASPADRGRMLPDPTTLSGKVHSAVNRGEHLPTDTAFSCQCLAV